MLSPFQSPRLVVPALLAGSYLTLFSVSLSAAPEYLLKDLGPGDAYAVNNHGVVVGDSPAAAFLHNGQSRTNIAFDWNYGPTNPEFTDHSTAVTAHGINDDGIIIGTFVYPPPINLPHVYRWDGSGVAQAFYPYDAASSINASGQVVGGTSLFQPGWTVEVLDGTGLAINDEGIIGGHTGFEPISGWAAVRAPGGVFVPLDLSALPPFLDGRGIANSAKATAINSAGQIIGEVHSFIPAVGLDASSLFIWSDGVPTEIARNDTFYQTKGAAGAINDEGVVVGKIVVTGDIPHAFRWKNGKPDDLNGLVEAAGWELSEARDINESGVIVGWGKLNGEKRAFRLDPVNPGDPIPPFVVTQPVGGRFGLGESTTLTFTATGTAPIEFQWQKNQADLPGETNSSLTLISMDAGSSGEYRVRVRNVAGDSYSNNATITVLDPEIQVVLMSGLWIQGAVGGQYEVQKQAAPSLGVTNWVGIATVTLTNSPQLWIDLSTSTNNAPRFYQAVRILP